MAQRQTVRHVEGVLGALAHAQDADVAGVGSEVNGGADEELRQGVEAAGREEGEEEPAAVAEALQAGGGGLDHDHAHDGDQEVGGEAGHPGREPVVELENKGEGLSNARYGIMCCFFY